MRVGPDQGTLPPLPKLEVSGAALVALQDRGGNVFDVKAYGAKGDGVADDLGSNNTAVTAIRAAGGGTLYFPAGTYKITGEILLDGYYPGASPPGTARKFPFLVRGAGAECTTINMANPLNPTINGIRTVYAGAADLSKELYMEIRDLRFDASGAPPTAGAAIRQECDPAYQNVILVRNCWFQETWDGVNTTASGGTIVKNCTFLNPLHAAIFLEQRVPENTDVGAIHIANNFFLGLRGSQWASGATSG